RARVRNTTVQSPIQSIQSEKGYPPRSQRRPSGYGNENALPVGTGISNPGGRGQSFAVHSSTSPPNLTDREHFQGGHRCLVSLIAVPASGPVQCLFQVICGQYTKNGRFSGFQRN